MEGILKYGQKALDPVLAQFHNPSPEVRSSAISVGITILRMTNDAASRARVIAIIRTTISDPEYLARSSALEAIEGLDDWKQFLPALREIPSVRAGLLSLLGCIAGYANIVTIPAGLTPGTNTNWRSSRQIRSLPLRLRSPTTIPMLRMKRHLTPRVLTEGL